MHKFKVIKAIGAAGFESALEEFVNSLKVEPIEIKFAVEGINYVALVYYEDIETYDYY